MSAVTTDGGWLETPIPDTVATELAEIPGVHRTEVIRILPGQLFRGLRIALWAVSSDLVDPARYPAGWYRAGDPVAAAAALRAGTATTVSVSLADRLGLAVGDPVELDAPNGPLTLSIAGIVPDYMSDQGSLIFDRKVLMDHWHDHAVNRVLLFLDPAADPTAVRQAVGERFAGRFLLKILSPAETVAFHTAHVDRAFVLMDAIQLLIAIVTVAGILDLLLSSILERRRELALWRRIGADRARSGARSSSSPPWSERSALRSASPSASSPRGSGSASTSAPRYGSWFVEGDPAGAMPLLRTGAGATIATALADRFGLHVGDTVALDTATGVLTLPIVGVVRD